MTDKERRTLTRCTERSVARAGIQIFIRSKRWGGENSACTYGGDALRVDGDGKIERLRRECPQPECGAGVFMAAMHNRQYCGKCHLTYVFDEAK
ncbi:ubiquitin-40s ribosomal s27a [Pyrenophora seminiperda CCB06]|uniref:Ubiquitin-40s ribosomal s27a n=1 Tax=Pyrenophora seminiperda CCB06 TaxID=1302712 RepID=A0A3M7M5M1_9PLEO|nr:ubiquitin-40s ribosomal s27a [Pyrenophora seminiperda CCB06]